MRLRTLARKATKETVAIEPFNTVDGQGSPSYTASQNIEAFVIEDQTGTESDGFVVDADGSHVRIALTLWVPGDETPAPGEKDRITRSGSTFIVEGVRTANSLKGTTDHYKVVCRDE